MKDKGLSLYSNIREFKTIGGMDCVGLYYGFDIETHVREELEKETDTRRAGELLLEGLYYHDCDKPWWTSISSYESEPEQQERMLEFISFMRYSDDYCPIFVGHSLFFRKFYKTRLSSTLRRNRPLLSDNLLKYRLANTTVLAMTLEFFDVPKSSSGCDARIVDADILFGGGFHKPNHKKDDLISSVSGQISSLASSLTSDPNNPELKSVLDRFGSFKIPTNMKRTSMMVNEFASDMKKFIDGLNPNK